MSVRNWTDAQRSAIEDEGGALLVSAAAGSGKTAVLVERAVRLITQGDAPIPADRLLIVTFTNAAAEELRSRIGVRLEDEVRQNPGNAALRRQRILLRRAFIGTIDAFCMQLVREHFGRLNIPPDVAVADAPLLGQLSQEAIAQTMEEMYEDADFAAFSSLYGRARSDAPAEEAVLALYEFTRTLPGPDAQLARFAAMYDGTAPLAGTPWGEELFAYARQALNAARQQCQAALDAAREDEALAVYIPMLAEDLAAAERVLAALAERSWDGAGALLRGYAFPALRQVRGYNGPGKERVKLLRAGVKKIFEDLRKYCFAATEAEFQADRQAARPLAAALCRAAGLYGRYYYAAKLAEKVLDFSDFEHLALRLLQDEDGERTPVAALVSRRYSAVMVDEYQDTNELQSALYECLANPAGSNLFYVGDVKQSIYRFRKANPGIFLAKKQAWAPHAGGGHPAVITLGHNFRSSRAVIAGVNFVFDAVMSRELGDIDYNEDERLIPGGDAPDAGPETAGMELHIVDDAEEQGDAAFVAARIAQMVAEGAPVREGAATRPCNYGDFCILLRARGNMLAYVQALEARGIPVSADLSGELLATPEVLPVTAMLAAIDNPGDDVSLAAAMLGPLFQFTPDDLARLRAASPKGSLWGALLQSDEPKMRALVQQFAFYRALAAEVPAGRLCEEIVGRTGYLSAVAAMEGGAARRENLLRFIGWAGEASAAGRGGLAGFVRFIQNGKGPAEAAARSVPGHVTLLTIHKSKGLEFPICILADTARGFNKMDLNARVQMHAQLGIGLALRMGDTLFPTLPALAIRHRVLQEALSEEMRVLYVALTRAKDRAIVTLATKRAGEYLARRAAELGPGGPLPFMLARANCMGDWIVAAALCHPDAGPLLEHTGGILPPRLAAGGRFAMAVECQPAAQSEKRQRYTLTAAPDEALIEALLASFSRQLPRAPLAALPLKMSVSALAKAGAQRVPKRPSFMYKSGLTAAEKGTAQHAFLQFANYTAAARDLEAEISRLCAEGFMEPDVADKLDRTGLRAFLTSPLAARMLGAESLLREYDFITAIPAGSVEPGLPASLAGEAVLVQGIADAVVVHGGEAEIVDYKTDRGVTPEELRLRYRPQLALYRAAIEKRLGLPVTRLTLWSFSLSAEVAVPLPEPGFA